jgi:hypothetical protein
MSAPGNRRRRRPTKQTIQLANPAETMDEVAARDIERLREADRREEWLALSSLASSHKASQEVAS